ncbi:MAG TPA: S8 family serine peptidase [Solirubrobacter sp.]|nr:S8 family serine peptidase [Solirubrobacter sp.]
MIFKRLLLLLAVAVAALGTTAAAASAGELPRQWDPRAVAVNRDADNTFLLRPGQILAAAADAADVQRALPGWRQSDRRPSGVTLFTRAPQDLDDPAREVLDALARVRKATAGRPQGPAHVAPNHVFVGESAAINFYGEPRVQGGPGSSVRLAKPPAALPLRTTRLDDGEGVRIAVLDTGMFDHAWLNGVERAPGSGDVWDVEGDGYADAEAGHGTFIAGLLLQVAPAARVYSVKVLDSHGVGDDLDVADAIALLPPDVDIVNLSLGGYTDHNAPPPAIATALRLIGKRHGAVVAAAGNQGVTRPFWPAAFDQVLAVGAVEEKGGAWTRADYSNHGGWVDVAARGSNLQSTFASDKTKVAQGLTIDPSDPWIAFGGWASWDGTSFATPIAAAMLARTMSRKGLSSAADAQALLLAAAPPAPQPAFLHAVLLDELEGRPDLSLAP